MCSVPAAADCTEGKHLPMRSWFEDTNHIEFGLQALESKCHSVLKLLKVSGLH